MKQIYIVLTHTGTVLSNIVKFYTKKDYTHVSISLDSEFKRLHSFGRLNPNNPFKAAFERIPKGYQKILDYLGANGFKENHGTKYLSCFEEVYEKDGITCMDIYIHADCVGKGNLHTDFSRDT